MKCTGFKMDMAKDKGRTGFKIDMVMDEED